MPEKKNLEAELREGPPRADGGEFVNGGGCNRLTTPSITSGGRSGERAPRSKKVCTTPVHAGGGLPCPLL